MKHIKIKYEHFSVSKAKIRNPIHISKRRGPPCGQQHLSYRKVPKGGGVTTTRAFHTAGLVFHFSRRRKLLFLFRLSSVRVTGIAYSTSVDSLKIHIHLLILFSLVHKQTFALIKLFISHIIVALCPK